MVKKSFARLHELKETWFIAVVVKSVSSLHKEKYGFNKIVLNRILYFVKLIATSDKLIAT